MLHLFFCSNGSLLYLQDKEAERIRVETAQRISGETEKHWDDAGSMDLRTKNILGFAGVQCRIIGTFFLEENGQNREASLNLKLVAIFQLLPQ